eukprot:31015-Pelagococcus_subviridis.AAC.1
MRRPQRRELRTRALERFRRRRERRRARVLEARQLALPRAALRGVQTRRRRERRARGVFFFARRRRLDRPLHRRARRASSSRPLLQTTRERVDPRVPVSRRGRRGELQRARVRLRRRRRVDDGFDLVAVADVPRVFVRQPAQRRRPPGDGPLAEQLPAERFQDDDVVARRRVGVGVRARVDGRRRREQNAEHLPAPGTAQVRRVEARVPGRGDVEVEPPGVLDSTRERERLRLRLRRARQSVRRVARAAVPDRGVARVFGFVLDALATRARVVRDAARG